MGKDISSPHDVFFKNIMGRVEIARTYIRHYLPVEITSQMDLDTLEVDTQGYVDDHLKAYFSDVVATVNLTDGQPSDIYTAHCHTGRGISWHCEMEMQPGFFRSVPDAV